MRRFGRTGRSRGRGGDGRRLFFLLLLFAVIGGIAYLLWQAQQQGAPPEAPPAPVAVEAPVSSDGALPEAAPPASIPGRAAEASRMYGFYTAVMQDGEIVERYTREGAVDFPAIDYAQVEGLTTYGGNNFRDTFAYGTSALNEKQLSRAWEHDVGSLRTDGGDLWQGTGWTGMPLIVRWEDAVRRTLGVAAAYKEKADFTEVIYPAADGNIYFFELESGAMTRAPIEIGVVMKGTATLDPRGYPVLYVGQGVEGGPDGKGAWVRAVSLIENKVIWNFGGRDPFAPRAYYAYDGSALLDGKTDTLFVPGENGVLYSTKLHTAYDPAAGTLSVAPEPLVKYRYAADGYGTEDGARAWGIESSVTAYGAYAFVTDNGGFLQCIDLNSMTLNYAVDLLDESDATVVAEQSGARLYLYTATLLHNGRGGDAPASYHRKLDAFTGEILWEARCAVVDTGDATDTIGTLATPHVGRGQIENLVIYNCTMTPYTASDPQGRGGCIVAYDKETGAQAWRYEQEGGLWSSPVVVYDENGRGYVLQCDRTGKLLLLDAADGELLFTLDLGSRIESTPAVFNDMLVVGTKGQYGSGEGPKILGVRLR